MNWFEFSLSGFLAVFVVLNVINVVIQTIKSIATIKCGSLSAAIVNAIAYGLYTIVVVYMSADGLGLFWKAIIIGVANLIGVFAVKEIERKNRKDKLWKVEATVYDYQADNIHRALKICNIPHNYIIAGKYVIFNCYCATQKESVAVRGALTKVGAKYFVSESKTL